MKDMKRYKSNNTIFYLKQRVKQIVQGSYISPKWLAMDVEMIFDGYK